MGVTKKESPWIRVLVLLACVVTVATALQDALPGIGVRFKENSPSFKVAIFTDLHYGENAWEAWGPEQDANSTIVQSFLLDNHSPDFVIYLGDVITANNLPHHDATLHWQYAVRPTVARGIPFASIFGNHDDAPFEWAAGSGVGPDAPLETTSRVELMEFDTSLPSSFSAAGPATLRPSVSNFVIPIASSDGRNVVAIMYFLDSGGGSMMQVITPDQTAWFTTTASQINPDASIPELVFWHIPSVTYTQAGPGARKPIQAPCVGNINDESIAPQAAEGGIMDALATRNSVKAVFVGHNHGLDWCCPYQKLHLCFARHTGYGGYGKWKRGARFVEIDLQEQIKSYVIIEDGSVASDMILALKNKKFEEEH
jgi:predicted phosphodiesterase